MKAEPGGLKTSGRERPADRSPLKAVPAEAILQRQALRQRQAQRQNKFCLGHNNRAGSL